MENKTITQMYSEGSRRKQGIWGVFFKPLIETSAQFTSKIHHKKIKELISTYAFAITSCLELVNMGVPVNIWHLTPKGEASG